MTGSCNGFEIPEALNDGPIPRTKMLCGWFVNESSRTMNPPINTFAPVPTKRRVAMFPKSIDAESAVL